MPKQNEPWIDNNLPQIDAKEVLIGLRSYANEVIKTIKNIHGVWAKPMYAVDGLMKAKMRPTVFNAKPDAASDECYILGFQSKGGLTRNLIHDAAHYGEAIANEPEHNRIIYRGTAVIGNTVVIYVDKTQARKPDELFTGLEILAQKYKSAGRRDFIKSIIMAARSAGVEDLLVEHWPEKIS